MRNLISQIIEGANEISSSRQELSATTQEVSSKAEENIKQGNLIYEEKKDDIIKDKRVEQN